MLIKEGLSKARYVKNETQTKLALQSLANLVVLLVLLPLLVAGFGHSDAGELSKRPREGGVAREKPAKERRRRKNALTTNELTTTSFRTATVAIFAEFPDWVKSGTQRLETHPISHGTGVLLDNGLVVTCRHVVDKSNNPATITGSTGYKRYSRLGVARHIRISYRDKETNDLRFSDAHIVAISKDSDLAFLKPVVAIPSEINLGTRIHEPKQEDELCVIVSPEGLPGNELHVARYEFKKKGNKFTFSNIDIQETWSGSPIFSRHSPNHGLLGLLSLKLKSPHTGGVAVSAEAIHHFLSNSKNGLKSDYIEGVKTINKIELQLSPKAIELGDGGIFDGLNVRLWLVSGQDKDHCEWRQDISGNADKSGKLVFNEQCRIPWRSNGVPLRIEVWEEDNIISKDDKMDVGMFTHTFPQDAEFPWNGKVRLMNGSTVTFYE